MYSIKFLGDSLKTVTGASNQHISYIISKKIIEPILIFSNVILLFYALFGGHSNLFKVIRQFRTISIVWTRYIATITSAQTATEEVIASVAMVHDTARANQGFQVTNSTLNIFITKTIPALPI